MIDCHEHINMRIYNEICGLVDTINSEMCTINKNITALPSRIDAMTVQINKLILDDSKYDKHK